MMNTTWFQMAAVIMSTFLSFACFAQEPDEFDENKDGKLNQTELRAFVLHRHSPTFHEIDKNKDGKIDPKEIHGIQEIIEKAKEDAVFDRQDILDTFGDRDSYTVEEIKVALKIEPPVPDIDMKGILIRRSHEVITVLEAPEKLGKAQPARFSYTRDFNDDSDTWQATGAILRPFRIYTSQKVVREKSWLTAINLVPSISFDRVNNEKEDSEDVNSLVFRLGGEIELGGLFDLQYTRLFLTYASDFSFESSVGAIEFEWEPVLLNFGIGTGRYILGGALEYRLRPILHTEYGKTFDAGDKDDLEEDDDFFRIGPKLQLGIWPQAKGLRRVSLSLKWDYLEGLVGKPGNSSLFEAALGYQLDKLGHFVLEFSYRNGDIPLTQEDTETFAVGLGVKF